MIRDLRNLYIAIMDNKVVLFETNLVKFVCKMKKIESRTKSYSYYNKKFKAEKIILLTSEFGKVYFLQKLV